MRQHQAIRVAGVVASMATLAFTPQAHGAIPTDVQPVVAAIQLPNWAETVAVSPDGRSVYVNASSSNAISVIDAASGTVTARLKVADVPTDIAFTPDGRTALVTNIGAETVSFIDTAGPTVVGRIAVADSPHAVAISPDGTRAYVVHTGAAELTVLDVTHRTALPSIPLPQDWSVSVAVNPKDGKVLALMQDRRSVLAVVDPAAGAVTSTIPIAGVATNVLVSQDGAIGYVLVASPGPSHLLKIDLASGSIVGQILIGYRALGMSLTADGRTLLITSQGSIVAPAGAKGANAALVNVLDASSLSRLGTLGTAAAISLGAEAMGVAANPAVTRVYVALSGGRRGSGLAFLDMAALAQTPGLASSITAKRSRSSARISWVPAAATPAGPTNLTVVTAIPVAEGWMYDVRTCVTAGRSCQVTGLEPSLKYEITVQSRNAAGWGPATPMAAPLKR